MNNTTKAFLAVAALTITAGAWAETAQARKFEASRLRVHTACGSNGTTYGTNSSGSYGCLNKNGWVHCNKNGKCTGGRIAARSTRNSNRALPPPRNR